MAARDTGLPDSGLLGLGALWLILDDAGRVLVVQPSYKPAGHYQLVGGCIEPGEAPHQAAIREGWEEIRVPMVPDTLLLLDYTPPTDEPGSVGRLNLVFLHRLGPGDTVTLNSGTPEGEEPELTDFKWLSAEELDEHCIPAQALRIGAAMEAADDPAKRGYRFEGRLISYPAA